MRRTAAAWRVLLCAAFVARPWTCGVALGLEPRSAEQPYRSIDPHGFGVMGAFVAALVCAAPVLWLLLQRRPEGAAAPPAVETRRGAAVLLVIGAPMLFQFPYARLDLAYSWPVLASATVWLALVLAACLTVRGDGPSIHGAFDRHPRVAWGIVAAIAAAKIGFAASVFA